MGRTPGFGFSREKKGRKKKGDNIFVCAMAMSDRTIKPNRRRTIKLRE
jgi:hypothetical protein